MEKTAKLMAHIQFSCFVCVFIILLPPAYYYLTRRLHQLSSRKTKVCFRIYRSHQVIHSFALRYKNKKQTTPFLFLYIPLQTVLFLSLSQQQLTFIKLLDLIKSVLNGSQKSELSPSQLAFMFV